MSADRGPEPDQPQPPPEPHPAGGSASADGLAVPRAAYVVAGVVATQVLLFAGYAISELGYGVVTRSSTGIAVAVFLGAYALGVALAVRALLQLRIAARAPVLLALLLHLALSWNARAEPTTWLAVVVAAMSLTGIVALLRPSLTRALIANDPDLSEQGRGA